MLSASQTGRQERKQRLSGWGMDQRELPLVGCFRFFWQTRPPTQSNAIHAARCQIEFFALPAESPDPKGPADVPDRRKKLSAALLNFAENLPMPQYNR